MSLASIREEHEECAASTFPFDLVQTLSILHCVLKMNEEWRVSIRSFPYISPLGVKDQGRTSLLPNETKMTVRNRKEVLASATPNLWALTNNNT